MKVLRAIQRQIVGDAVRAKFAMVPSILTATLNSLARDRINRLGGMEQVTLHDLAREFREGHGDAGICFELAVHEAIASENETLYPYISEVLESECGISGGAASILFGPEKNGVFPILESVANALTDESRVYVGNRGQPPKLKRYIPKIIRAFYRNEERNQLPRSISGLWKADLFLGNTSSDKWIGTTIKINPSRLQGAQGLRIGIYPRQNNADVPRHDHELNLVRLPLPYDGDFMEVFYKSFFLVRAFLHADAQVPPPVALPDAEDRFVTEELHNRRDFPILAVIDVIRAMAQPDLLEERNIENVEPAASLTNAGLGSAPEGDDVSELVSIAPGSTTE